MVGKRSGYVVLWLAILLCLLGWFSSWQLNIMSLKGKAAAAKFINDVCTARESFSCEAVANSKWGKLEFLDYDRGDIRRSVNTSLLGAVYFTMLLAWYVFIGRSGYRGRFWHLLPLGLAGCGITISGLLTYVLLFRMSVTCPWCLFAHATNLGIFVCTILLWPKKPAPAPAGVESPPADPDHIGIGSPGLPLPTPPSSLARRYPSFRQAAGVLLLAFMTAGVQLYYSLDREMLVRVLRIRGQLDSLTRDERVKEALKKEQKRLALPWREDDPVLGDRNAPETLTLFSDFECPSCASFHHKLPEILKKFDGKPRVIFKHNPFCTDCNPYIGDKNVHPNGCTAAYAAEAARILGGNEAFWKMADLLIENRSGLGRIDYGRLARRVGLDAEAFKQTMNSEAVKRRVKEDIDLAKKAGCVSTPDLYRNDVHFTNWYGAGSSEAWKDWMIESKRRPAGGDRKEQQAATRPAFNDGALPTADIALRPDDAIRGPKDAPNTLVVFYSLQSRGCLGFHLSLLPIAEKTFGGKLRVVFRHMPIDSACNPHIAEARHPQGCRAAYALEAARVVGGPEAFWKMVNLLLRNQDKFGQVDWNVFARQLGLDVGAFAQAMAGKAVADRVRADIDLAYKQQLTHTPAVYCNGQFVRRLAEPAVWQKLAGGNATPDTPDR